MFYFKGLYLRLKPLLRRLKWVTPKMREQLRTVQNQFPAVLTTRETLEFVTKNRASLCRFGDAEFDVCLHLDKDDPYQRPSEELSQRLREILQYGCKAKLVVAIPPFNSSTNNLRDFFGTLSFWEWYWLVRFNVLRPFLIGAPYGNSFVSRSSVFYENTLEEVCTLWEGRDVVFVIGKGGRFIFDQRLFGCIASHETIFVPPCNAFSEYDRVFAECRKFERDRLFLIAAGPTATVLAFDLHKLGYQAIDIGHISICYREYLGESMAPESLPMMIAKLP